MPKRLAMSEIGNTVETPVRRSNRALTGPESEAGVVVSAVVIVSGVVVSAVVVSAVVVSAV